MEAVSKLHLSHQPLPVSLHHHRPSFSPPISSLSFTTPPPLKSSLSIKASLSPFSNKTPNKPQFTQTLNPFPFSLLKTTLITAVAATAVFFARFNLKPLYAIAAPPPPTVETVVSEAEKEKTLKEYASSHPDDVQALRNLMEAKIKNRKIDEAIGVIEQLIRLEPNDVEWPLLKAHMYCYNGELEIARFEFKDILEKDPFRVEAYHGLVMAASQGDSGGELKEVEKKVKEAIEMCKKEKKRDELRDFKLLIAQIRVIEGNYIEALKVYEELVKEEPRDFRPYLCQGIIYTLLRKTDEAEKQFQKYRRLVPKGHPYAQYFEDNMIATKVFGQKVENERAGSKS